MRLKSGIFGAALIFVLLSSPVRADQIILKDGTEYSGKFVRGDSNIVEFRVLNRVESFKTLEVAQIIFKEPELAPPARPSATTGSRASATRPSAPVVSAQPEPAAPPAATVSKTEPRPQLIRGESQQNSPASETTLPTGTPITIRTSAAIDTDRNRVGDIFDATLDEPLLSGGLPLVPRGATVKGRIAYAKESGKLVGQSQLILELTEININGKFYVLRTSDYTEAGSSRGNRTAATVGGTAALGAIIGAIAGGGKGAAVGAASGAAVGTGVQVLTKGQVLKIPAETILEFKLQSPLTINVL
jgi:hypothetical protein